MISLQSKIEIKLYYEKSENLLCYVRFYLYKQLSLLLEC